MKNNDLSNLSRRQIFALLLEELRVNSFAIVDLDDEEKKGLGDVSSVEDLYSNLDVVIDSLNGVSSDFVLFDDE